MAEVKLLKKQYKNTINGELAEEIDRTVAAIRAKAKELGLKKNKTFMSKVAKLKGKKSKR